MSPTKPTAAHAAKAAASKAAKASPAVKAAKTSPATKPASKPAAAAAAKAKAAPKQAAPAAPKPATAPKPPTPATPSRAAIARPPVVLLGVGPGDPDLLTVRAARALAEAEVILAGEEVPASLLRDLSAEIVPVTPDDDAAKEMASRARAGQKVVRVYAGDVFDSPRGVREATALHRAKVGFEVTPGIPVASGVSTYAGIAPGSPSTIAAVGDDEDPDWAALAAVPGTLVLTLASFSEAGKAVAALIEHGKRADTPIAVAAFGTTNRQTTVVSTLEAVEAECANLSAIRAKAGSPIAGPAVAIVGAAVKSREKLSWWETRALFGWTVLVPRTREQAGTLSEMLRAHGATPLEVPTIAVEQPRTPAPMERAVKGLISGRYQWIAFTSTNAVKAVRERFEEYGLDARAFSGVRVAAVGEVTAEALIAWGIVPELVPSGTQSSEGLLADWPPYDEVLDPIDRVLLPRADIATETLAAGLLELGWQVDDVTAYRTVRAAPPPAPIREALKGGGVDAVLFTSSSTVRNLVGIAGKPHESTVIAVIGPATAQAVRDQGLRVDVESREPNVPALVAALAQFALERRAQEALDAASGAKVVALPRGRRKR
jgi:uroporphyrinogen III methyltransferase / synthase